RTYGGPRRREREPSSLGDPRGEPAAAAALVEPIGQPGKRNREGDEDQRSGDIGREVEGRRGVDLRLAEGLDRPDERNERRVLLQADEVVQERRDDAPDRLGDDD